jgi:hypothetical protein
LNSAFALLLRTVPVSAWGANKPNGIAAATLLATETTARPAGRSDRRQSLPTTLYTDVIIAEIHHAINKLGGSARPTTSDEAQRALRDLGADVDLRSIVDSWGDTLSDEQTLHLLRNWNAGLPLFQAIYASKPQDDDYGTGGETSEDDE